MSSCPHGDASRSLPVKRFLTRVQVGFKTLGSLTTRFGCIQGHGRSSGSVKACPWYADNVTTYSRRRRWNRHSPPVGTLGGRSSNLLHLFLIGKYVPVQYDHFGLTYFYLIALGVVTSITSS